MIILTISDEQQKDIAILERKLPYLVDVSAKMNNIANSIKAQGIRNELVNTKDRLDSAIRSIKRFVNPDGQSQLPMKSDDDFSHANDETFVAKQKLDLQVISEMMNDL